MLLYITPIKIIREQRVSAHLLFLFFILTLGFGLDFEYGLGLMLRLEFGLGHSNFLKLFLHHVTAASAQFQCRLD